MTFLQLLIALRQTSKTLEKYEIFKKWFNIQKHILQGLNLLETNNKLKKVIGISNKTCIKVFGHQMVTDADKPYHIFEKNYFVTGTETITAKNIYNLYKKLSLLTGSNSTLEKITHPN